MALTSKEAELVIEALKDSKSKLTIAHYRRQLPIKKVKSLLDCEAIGDILYAEIQILQPAKSERLLPTLGIIGD